MSLQLAEEFIGLKQNPRQTGLAQGATWTPDLLFFRANSKQSCLKIGGLPFGLPCLESCFSGLLSSGSPDEMLRLSCGPVACGLISCRRTSLAFWRPSLAQGFYRDLASGREPGSQAGPKSGDCWLWPARHSSHGHRAPRSWPREYRSRSAA